MNELSGDDKKRWDEAVASGEPTAIQEVLDEFPQAEVDWSVVFFNISAEIYNNVFSGPRESFGVWFYDKHREHINLDEIFKDYLEEDEYMFVVYSKQIVSFVVGAKLSTEARRIAILLMNNSHSKIIENILLKYFSQLQKAFPEELSKAFLAELESGVAL